MAKGYWVSVYPASSDPETAFEICRSASTAEQVISSFPRCRGGSSRPSRRTRKGGNSVFRPR